MCKDVLVTVVSEAGVPLGGPLPVAVHGVVAGRGAAESTHAPNEIARMDDYRRGHDAVVSRRPMLSRREVEVLLTWLRAESKEDAAAELFISASTVSTHLARIRAKYTAAGRPAPTKTHLLARALQDGYTSLDRW
ncbi:putative LuxR family transcriptional regulator [Gordonia aichiensis NBRC 108223]|uniref:Putative LuxR family transcriptional regulator n=1 Tax=Gordonia aichiensis NBRC 108223 TaxID=1220583 RepID=L7KEH6_9ACTN|nr:putative LuxR family transcriptional regulator [Gordonia aichiensis NBRC 108223]